MTCTKMNLNEAGKQIGFACSAILLLVGFCFSQTISVSPKTGPPTAKTLVSGSGFSPNAAIDIYFDAQEETVTTANSSGAFSQVAIQVPASALPGKHWVSAEESTGQNDVQVPFYVNTNWTEFHTPDMMRWNPYENVLNVNNVGNLQLKWSYATGAGVDDSPIVVNGVAYFGSDDYNIYALNALTGAKLWSYRTGNYVYQSPAIANGVLYVGSVDGNVYALNTKTGTLLWSYYTGGEIDWGSPAVWNGVVYATSTEGDALFALNASTGTLLWSYPTCWHLDSAPAIANGVVYIGDWCGIVYAFNASTGALLWTSNTDGGIVYRGPALANGVVYIGTNYGNLFAFEASTGAQLWSFGTGGGIYASPAVANGVVYIGSNGQRFYALNASTGAEIWSYPTNNDTNGSPAVANGVVYFGVGPAFVYALNASTGALLWSGPGHVDSSPTVVDGMVFVSEGNTDVAAFGLN